MGAGSEGLAAAKKVAAAAAKVDPRFQGVVAELLPDHGLAHAHYRLGETGALVRAPKQSQMDLAPADALAYEAACFQRAAPSGATPRLFGVISPEDHPPRGALIVEEITGRVQYGGSCRREVEVDSEFRQLRRQSAAGDGHRRHREHRQRPGAPGHGRRRGVDRSAGQQLRGAARLLPGCVARARIAAFGRARLDERLQRGRLGDADAQFDEMQRRLRWGGLFRCRHAGSVHLDETMTVFCDIRPTAFASATKS